MSERRILNDVRRVRQKAGWQARCPPASPDVANFPGNLRLARPISMQVFARRPLGLDHGPIRAHQPDKVDRPAACATPSGIASYAFANVVAQAAEADGPCESGRSSRLGNDPGRINGRAEAVLALAEHCPVVCLRAPKAFVAWIPGIDFERCQSIADGGGRPAQEKPAASPVKTRQPANASKHQASGKFIVAQDVAASMKKTGELGDSGDPFVLGGHGFVT